MASRPPQELGNEQTERGKPAYLFEGAAGKNTGCFCLVRNFFWTWGERKHTIPP